MNIEYLIQHLSYDLHTVVRRYSNDRILQDKFCARLDFDDKIIWTQEVETQLIKPFWKQKRYPDIISVNDQFAYAVVGTKKGIFIIGPVQFLLSASLKNKIQITSVPSSWRKAVFSCEFTKLANNILLLYNLFQKEIISLQQLVEWNYMSTEIEKVQQHFSEIVFQNLELEQAHNPYAQEVREFSSIENGDLELLKRSWEEDYTGQIGILAKDPVRNVKNLGIVVITLASRAAIRGGVIPEVSFSLSDSYIKRIEEINDPITIYHFIRQSEYQYAKMVYERKKQQRGNYRKDQNLRINQCKDYIFTHLHGKIHIQEIADELFLNANYLSEIFHQWEGISITQFILQEKIKLVKNLLIYSNYSYIEIANYLGFSSQSYLGKQFKKYTNMTLRQYREKYRVKEFLKEKTGLRNN